jgi:thiamine-phosphate diphosphorylase
VIVNEDPEAVRIAGAALSEGVRIVQYRAKGALNRATFAALRRATNDAGALLILNDDWRAAMQNDCDGVHLGPEDDGFRTPGKIRAAWPDSVIGLSCATNAEIRALESADVDYVGAGSVYATGSKQDAGAPIGVERLHDIVQATSLPVAAIGGITAEKIGEIKRSGAAMAAVISAIASSENPAAASRRLVRAWNEG